MANIDNENNEKLNNEKKAVDKVKRAKLLSIIAFLAILFCSTYFITDYFNDPNKRKVEVEEEDKVVLNQTPQVLKDDTIIILKTKDNIDGEKKLLELKSELKLTGDVTKEILAKALEVQGYKLGEIKEDKIVFSRNSEHVLIANKFYIGEKDGNLAIFKTNEAGEPQSIYVDGTPINILPEKNQQSLKNFEVYYDSEEEAHMMLTAYTS